jgi:hypothetical protein
MKSVRAKFARAQTRARFGYCLLIDISETDYLEIRSNLIKPVSDKVYTTQTFIWVHIFYEDNQHVLIDLDGNASRWMNDRFYNPPLGVG